MTDRRFSIADKVLKFLREREPWRPDDLLLYSPDQVRRAIHAVEDGHPATLPCKGCGRCLDCIAIENRNNDVNR